WLEVNFAVVLEGNELEICLALKKIRLYFPYRKSQSVIPITQAVAEVYDASHLHIRQCERLYIYSETVAFHHRLIKRLAVERCNRTIFVDRAPADFGDRVPAVNVGKLDVRSFSSSRGQNLNALRDRMNMVHVVVSLLTEEH